MACQPLKATLSFEEALRETAIQVGQEDGYILTVGGLDSSASTLGDSFGG